jgi:hypothetical protein
MANVFALALAAAVYPTLLAGVIVILARPSPTRQLAAFLLGGMTFSVAVGLGLLFALKGSKLTTTSHKPTSVAIDLVAGAASLAAAFVLLTRRDVALRERRELRHERRRGGSAEPGATEPSTPWTKRTLERGSLPLAFAIGVLLNVPGVWYLAALKDISAGNHSVPVEVLLVLGFNVVMFGLIEVPLVCFLVAPERARELVRRFDVALHEHARQIGIAVATLVGAYLLVKGAVATG